VKQENQSLSISLVSELLMADQLLRLRLTKALPKGMELSHFSVLNHLAYVGEERTPAQLARLFHVTRGAMTNTLNRLDVAGYIHISPDWNDARRKLIAITPAGRKAREFALATVIPDLASILSTVGEERIRTALPVLREIRQTLEKRISP
jgi:DNA-binding MarR family transcriptional regulator